MPNNRSLITTYCLKCGESFETWDFAGFRYCAPCRKRMQKRDASKSLSPDQYADNVLKNIQESSKYKDDVELI